MGIDTGSGARAERDEARGAPGAQRSAPPDRSDWPEADADGYDVVVIGGGPAGLAAGALCGRLLLRAAVLEGDSWGGILTRWCPDKRIDNYPGVRPGIRASELAGLLVDDARRTRVALIDERAEEISRDCRVRAGDVRLRGKILILATGSTAAEAEIVGEKEFAAGGRGVLYAVPAPAALRGRRVVVVGGGDTAVSVVRRLRGIASRITLVHRQAALRSAAGLSETAEGNGVEIALLSGVDAIAGGRSVESVTVRNLDTGERRVVPADAVVMAVGRRPNTAIFRDVDLAIDAKGHIATDARQRTNLPGILAVGDVSSPLKMIVTAVAQAAAAAHEAYREIRSPYWK